MLLIMIPMIIQAVEVTIDGIRYEVVKKAKIATVIGLPFDKYSGDIIIPESIIYENVTCDVTSIGNQAFYDCSNLTSINIPNSVTSIGDEAFYDCSSLTSFSIPNNVTSIGIKAFYNCLGLQKVIVNDIAAWCKISFADDFSNPLFYAHYLYSDENTEITHLAIPEEVTSIGNYAFSSCSGLISINIPNSVTSLGNCAFFKCSSLTSINIPNNVTTIGYGAFFECSSLTSINIPNSVTSIGWSAFLGCSCLTSITIGNRVTRIEKSAFNGCNSLQKVIVNDIAAWCNISFEANDSNPLNYAHHLYSVENTEITNLIIPEGVTSIGNYAFSSCSGLTSINIPNSVKSIGQYAFNKCSSLESIVIGDGVSTIYSQTFNYCNKIKSITLGSQINSIGDYNFNNCEELEVVTCKVISVPRISGNNFQNCYIEYAKLIVPDESIEAYKSANIWKDFGTIEGLSGYTSEIEKCATPTIHYANGQLTFECETEGVTFQTTITDPDITSYSSNNINLTGKYLVKVYATKPGFENSDPATAEINLLEGSGPAIKGDVNNDGYVNMSDVTKIINIILGKEQ